MRGRKKNKKINKIATHIVGRIAENLFQLTSLPPHCPFIFIALGLRIHPGFVTQTLNKNTDKNKKLLLK